MYISLKNAPPPTEHKPYSSLEQLLVLNHAYICLIKHKNKIIYFAFGVCTISASFHIGHSATEFFQDARNYF